MSRDKVRDDQLVEMAKNTVLGVVTARESGSCADAELVLSGYLRDAVELGATPCRAWSMLFSAASLWVSALIGMYAEDHHETPAQSIALFAINHAACELGNE